MSEKMLKNFSKNFRDGFKIICEKIIRNFCDNLSLKKTLVKRKKNSGNRLRTHLDIHK